MSHTEPSPSVFFDDHASFTNLPSGVNTWMRSFDAVADVDEAVVRQLGAVHRGAELLRRRRVGIVAAEVGVVRLVAVGAPVALELAGVGVDDGDALVAVAVGDVGLVRPSRRRRSSRPCRSARCRCCRSCTPVLADLHQELAVLRELQHHAVAAAVAADPDVALVVDGDAVVRRRPLIAVAVAAAPVAAAGCPADRTRGSAAPSRSTSPVLASSAASFGVDACRGDGRSRRDRGRRRRRRSSCPEYQ